jgi:hypothetical protein
VDELQEEVWADVAGRANEYLLSLEDFAGFFSGKSLWKGITGVAGAVNGVAKAIADCRKLGRAFGWKIASIICGYPRKRLSVRH